ncbi:MAG: tetratricopeptide repeat protein [Acidobacteriota bacterium]
MRIRHRAVVAGLGVVLCSASVMAQVAWVPKLDEALRQAESEGKLVVIDVTASWCPPCQRMDTEVYPAAEFIEFSKSQIFMRVDVDNDPEGARIDRKYNVKAFPTILVLTPKGEEIERLVGGRDTQQLIRDLQEAFSVPVSLKELAERAKREGNDFQLFIDLGRRYLHREEYSKSIQAFEQAVSLSKLQSADERASLWILLSLAYQRDGKFSACLKALDELEKVDARLAQESSVRMQRAKALISMKKYEEGHALMTDLMRSSRSREQKESLRQLAAQLPAKYRKADKELAKSLQKAREQFKDGKLEKALSLTEQAVEQAPLADEAHMLLAAIHFRCAGETADAQRRSEHFSVGLSHLRLARRLDPENLNYYQSAKDYLASRYVPSSSSVPEAQKRFLKAEGFFAQDQFRSAAEEYVKAIQADPAFGKAYLHLGDCFFASKNYEEALKMYQQAIARTPLDASAYRFAADALLKLGRRQECREHLIASLVADPEYPLAWANLDSLAQSEGGRLTRHTEAVPLQFLLVGLAGQNYEEALFETVAPQTVPAWRTYVKQKLLWKEQLFKKRYPQESFYHSSSEEEIDCLKRAVEEWNRIRQENREARDEHLDFLSDAEANDQLEAFVFVELFTEEYRKSYEDWKQRNRPKLMAYINEHLFGKPSDRTVTQAPAEAVQFFNAALTHYQAGEKEEALDLYLKALQQQPGMVEALRNLSLLYLEMLQLEQARATAQNWVDTDPSSGMAHAVLAQICHRSGDRAGAVSALEKAVTLEKNEQAREGYQKYLNQLKADPKPITVLSQAPPIDPREALREASDALWNGEAEEAIEILEEALPLSQGVQQDEIILMLGLAHKENGDSVEAREYLTQYLKKHPNHPKAKEALESVTLKRKPVRK